MKVDQLLLLLEAWKFKYPFDPEKTCELINTYCESSSRGSHISGLELGDGDEEHGQDLEVPYWLEDNLLSDRFPSAVSLQELAKINKKVKKFIEDSNNFKASWGETGGMMPWEDSNYPEDAIITNITGDSSEPTFEIEFDELMNIAQIKPKYKEKFKDFLKEDWTERNIGIHAKNDEIDKEKSLTYFNTVELSICTYIKEADFKKLVKGVKTQEEKDLVKDILDRVGNYE